jgi:tRNA-dihydrouridine synthase
LANWEEIGKIAELKNKIAKDTVIIGNGDINDYADTLKVYKKYSIDGAMIGRGIFSNPWAFEKVETKKERHKKDYIEILIKHLNLFDQTWGDTKDFQIMKKFFKMYIREFKGADLLRKELMSYKDLLQAKNLLIEELNSTKD